MQPTITFQLLADTLGEAMGRHFGRWEDECEHEAADFRVYLSGCAPHGVRVDRVSGGPRVMRAHLTIGGTRAIASLTSSGKFNVRVVARPVRSSMRA